MDVESVKGKVREALETVPPLLRDIGGDRPWTFEVKTALAKLGQKLKFEVCCNGVEAGKADWQEWLFDMCWLEGLDDTAPPIYRSMPLAMECEWGIPAKVWALPDFQKLVFSSAKVRLLVWQAHNYDQLAHDVDFFRKQVQAVNGDTAAYLFAGWDGEKLKFAFF
jgi:hypothetical protein